MKKYDVDKLNKLLKSRLGVTESIVKDKVAKALTIVKQNKKIGVLEQYDYDIEYKFNVASIMQDLRIAYHYDGEEHCKEIVVGILNIEYIIEEITQSILTRYEYRRQGEFWYGEEKLSKEEFYQKANIPINRNF